MLSLHKIKACTGQSLTEFSIITILICLVGIVGFQSLNQSLLSSITGVTQSIAGVQQPDSRAFVVTRLNEPEANQFENLTASAREIIRGLADGLKTQVQDIWALITNPIETAKGLVDMAKMVVEDPGLALATLFESLKAQGTALIEGTPYEISKFVGENISPQALAAAGKKMLAASIPPIIGRKSPSGPELDPELLKDRPLFSNLMPEDLPHELEALAANSSRVVRLNDPNIEDILNAGPVKWAINEKGELWLIGHQNNSADLKHAVLTKGKPVYAAGQVEISMYDGVVQSSKINSDTGHFKVDKESLDIAIVAFRQHGIEFDPRIITDHIEQIYEVKPWPIKK